MLDSVYTIITAAFAGFSSGMFGIGGSVVATPFLRLLLNLSPLVAIATPLPAAIPSAISGSIFYHKNGLINYKLAFTTVLTAIPFGWLASHLTIFIDGQILIIIKALFLIVLGLKFFISAWLFKTDDSAETFNIFGSLIAGAIAGFVAGIIAVGGGIVLVTAFVRYNHLPMKKAVATSLFCVLITAIFNSIKHYSIGNIDLHYSVIMILTVVPFAYFGAKLATSLKNKTLEQVFGISMIIFAILFIVTELI